MTSKFLPVKLGCSTTSMKAEACVSSTMIGTKERVVGNDWATRKARHERKPGGVLKRWLERGGAHLPTFRSLSSRALSFGASRLLCRSQTRSLLNHGAVIRARVGFQGGHPTERSSTFPAWHRVRPGATLRAVQGVGQGPWARYTLPPLAPASRFTLSV